MSKTIRNYFKMVRNMTEFNAMEKAEQNTVAVSCTIGIAMGAFVVLCPALCVIVVVIGVVTQ